MLSGDKNLGHEKGKNRAESPAAPVARVLSQGSCGDCGCPGHLSAQPWGPSGLALGRWGRLASWAQGSQSEISTDPIPATGCEVPWGVPLMPSRVPGTLMPNKCVLSERSPGCGEEGRGGPEGDLWSMPGPTPAKGLCHPHPLDPHVLSRA